jgi:hypothetical protein
MQTAVIPQRKRLLELAGEWQGSGTMAVAGGSFPLTAHWSCKPNVTGYGLLCEVHIAGVPGMEHFVDVEQFGFDDADQQIHAGTVCNTGEAHHLSGAWSGDVLTVEDDREHFEVRLVSETEIAVQVVNKGGGPVFDLTFQR